MRKPAFVAREPVYTSIQGTDRKLLEPDYFERGADLQCTTIQGEDRQYLGEEAAQQLLNGEVRQYDRNTAAYLMQQVYRRKKDRLHLVAEAMGLTASEFSQLCFNE